LTGLLKGAFRLGDHFVAEIGNRTVPRIHTHQLIQFEDVVQRPPVVDHVVRQRRLESALLSTADVEVAGVCQQRFDLGVGQTEIGEVRIVQRERQVVNE